MFLRSCCLSLVIPALSMGCGRLMRSHCRNRKNRKGEMSMSHKTVLVVGSTGSIGHLVVEEALRQGYAVRALVRTPSKARRFPAQVDVISADVTRPETLTA